MAVFSLRAVGPWSSVLVWWSPGVVACLAAWDQRQRLGPVVAPHAEPHACGGLLGHAARAPAAALDGQTHRAPPLLGAGGEPG